MHVRGEPAHELDDVIAPHNKLSIADHHRPKTHKEPPKEEYYSNVELLTGVEGTLAIVFFEKEEIKQKVVKRDPPVTANNSKKEREANEIRETLGASLETKHLVAYVDIWMKDPENGKTAISREPALLGGQKNRILEILLHWMND